MTSSRKCVPCPFKDHLWSRSSGSPLPHDSDPISSSNRLPQSSSQIFPSRPLLPPPSQPASVSPPGLCWGHTLPLSHGCLLCHFRSSFSTLGNYPRIRYFPIFRCMWSHFFCSITGTNKLCWTYGALSGGKEQLQVNRPGFLGICHQTASFQGPHFQVLSIYEPQHHSLSPGGSISRN